VPVALAIALTRAWCLAAVQFVSRQVRVLNHGDEPFALWVDGKRVARVEPSSGESALARRGAHRAAGERDLRVVAEGGRELFRAREVLEGGSPHLFAPRRAPALLQRGAAGYGDAKDEPVDSHRSTARTLFGAARRHQLVHTEPGTGAFRDLGRHAFVPAQKRCAN